MNMMPQVKAFAINGKAVLCKNFGNGHINDTLKITTDTGYQYILQRINHYVFKEPVKVMENKGRLRNCHRPEETGDTRQPIARWYPGLNLEQNEAIQGKPAKFKSSLEFS